MEHLFYAGDNPEGLARRGVKVDLVYIDPPSAANNQFLIDGDRANTVKRLGQAGLRRHGAGERLPGPTATTAGRNTRCDVRHPAPCMSI